MLNIFIEFSSFIIYIEQNIHTPCSLFKNTISLQVLDCIDRVGDNPFVAIIKKSILKPNFNKVFN